MAARRIGLRHIEAFRAVMMTGSMTTAARHIHTSQPQISRLIAQLEAIAQFALFDRNGSRLSATLEGTRFYRDVEKTFVGLAELEASVVRIRSFSAGRLSVAAMPRLAGGLLARIVARFKAQYPDVIVSIHSGDAGAVHGWISSGFCDAGLAMLYADVVDIHVETVLTTACVAILPPGHRLTKAKRLRLSDFEGEPFISLPAGSPLRSRIDDIFASAGVARTVVAEASLGASICGLVAAGLGVSLINPIAADEERKSSRIETRPFQPAIPVDIALLFPAFHTRSRLVDVFSACARDIMIEELGVFAAGE